MNTCLGVRLQQRRRLGLLRCTEDRVECFYWVNFTCDCKTVFKIIVFFSFSFFFSFFFLFCCCDLTNAMLMTYIIDSLGLVKYLSFQCDVTYSKPSN